MNLSRSIPARYFKGVSVVVCLMAMIAASPVTLNQLSVGVRHIGDHALKDGPDSLPNITRFGLWWSAIWLSLGGIAIGTPYAVAEQVLMFWRRTSATF